METAWIHFQVPVSNGTPSTGTINMEALPPVLRDAIRTGGRWGFACNPAKLTDARNVMTNLACHVTCRACRRTKAWEEAPDDGPWPKDPDAVVESQEPPMPPR